MLICVYLWLEIKKIVIPEKSGIHENGGANVIRYMDPRVPPSQSNGGQAARMTGEASRKKSKVKSKKGKLFELALDDPVNSVYGL